MGNKDLFKIDGVVDTSLAPEPKIGESIFGGTTKKDFRGCSNDLLEKMFNDLSRENSSYITYLNRYIDARNRALKLGRSVPPFPDYVVSLFKDTRYEHDPKDAYANVASSIVGNMLGVPVAYNTVYTDEEDKNHIVSVSFLNNGKGFVTLNDCISKYPPLDYWTDFKYWEEVLKDLKIIQVPTSITNKDNHLRYQKGCKVILDDFRVASLIEEFIPSYLYRKFVLRDRDFNKKNVGFIVDRGNRTINWSPNFDVEAGLNRGRYFDFDPPQVYPDLKYIYSKYPQIVDKFMVRLETLTDLQKVDAELSRYIDDAKVREYFIIQIRDNVRELRESYSKIREMLQTK